MALHAYKCNKCGYVSPHDKRCAFCGSTDKSKYSIRETAREKKRKALGRIKGAGLQMNVGIGGSLKVSERTQENKRDKQRRAKALRSRRRNVGNNKKGRLIK